MAQFVAALQAAGPFALVGMGVGAIAGLLSWTNQSFESANRSHRDFRILAGYHGELVYIFTEVSKMKDKYSSEFFALFDGVKRLLVLSKYLDQLLQDPDATQVTWSFEATQYRYEADAGAAELLLHVDEYEANAAALRQHIGTIQEIAKTVTLEIAHRCLDASLNAPPAAHSFLAQPP